MIQHIILVRTFFVMKIMAKGNFLENNQGLKNCVKSYPVQCRRGSNAEFKVKSPKK